jgi:hypothetical protein
MLGDLGRLGVGTEFVFHARRLACDELQEPNVIDRDLRDSWYFSGRSDWLSRADDISELGYMGARTSSEAFIFY